MALGVTGAKRSILLPEVPTMVEAGIPNYVVEGWFGLFAPAGVPPPVIARLNMEVLKVLRDPVTIALLNGQGAEPAAGSPQEFGAFVAAERERWAKVIREANIALE